MCLQLQSIYQIKLFSALSVHANQFSYHSQMISLLSKLTLFRLLSS